MPYCQAQQGTEIALSSVDFLNIKNTKEYLKYVHLPYFDYRGIPISDDY